MFTEKRLRAELLRSVASALTREDIDAAEWWYSSELGRRITALEERATSQRADIAATKSKAAEAMAAASGTRRRQVKALDEALRASEQMSSVMLNMAVAVAYGVAKASNPVLTMDFKAVRTILAAQMEPLLAELSAEMPKLFALAYLTLKDEELGSYVEFNRSPAAVKFNNAIMDGMDRAFVQLSFQLGEEYVRSRERKRGA